MFKSELLEKMRFRYLLSKSGQVEWLRSKGMRIGNGCDLQDPCMFYDIDYSLIEIGDNVTVTATAGFMTHDGSTRVLVGNHVPFIPTMIGKIVIHDNVFVGVRSLIMPGVSIGPNSIIAAGSIVTKSFDGGYVIGGVPARKLKSIAEFFSGMGHLPRVSRRLADKKGLLSDGVKYLEVLVDHPTTGPFMEKLKNYGDGAGS